LQGVEKLRLLRGGQFALAFGGLASVGEASGAVSVPAFEDGAGLDIGQPDQGGGPLAAERLAGA
jgi:hypothetical protein